MNKLGIDPNDFVEIGFIRITHAVLLKSLVQFFDGVIWANFTGIAKSSSVSHRRQVTKRQFDDIERTLDVWTFEEEICDCRKSVFLPAIGQRNRSEFLRQHPMESGGRHLRRDKCRRTLLGLPSQTLLAKYARSAHVGDEAENRRSKHPELRHAAVAGGSRKGRVRPSDMGQTSKFRTFNALSSMNWRRGSTTSPIKIVNILSASTALSSFRSTLSNLRFSGFIVVSNNSLAFISPSPLKRLICTPRRPISKILCKISGMEKSGYETARSPSPSINSKIGRSLAA